MDGHYYEKALKKSCKYTILALRVHVEWKQSFFFRLKNGEFYNEYYRRNLPRSATSAGAFGPIDEIQIL
jgi:hypothetical protein